MSANERLQREHVLRPLLRMVQKSRYGDYQANREEANLHKLQRLPKGCATRNNERTRICEAIGWRSGTRQEELAKMCTNGRATAVYVRLSGLECESVRSKDIRCSII